MDIEELINRYLPLVKRHLFPLAVGFVGLMLLGYGLIGLGASSSGSNDVIFEKADSSQGSSQSANLVVDVEGAVVSPGVYNLPRESRIKDALVASGGVSAQADRIWVSKNLNLALKIIDGAKIYIPFEGEKQSSPSLSGSTGDNSAIGTAGSININSASEKELDGLPGVGPVTAQKIIDNRPYQTLEELVSKKAVSSKVLDSIKDKITLY
jgi:competence protein ComEA